MNLITSIFSLFSRNSAQPSSQRAVSSSQTAAFQVLNQKEDSAASSLVYRKLRLLPAPRIANDPPTPPLTLQPVSDNDAKIKEINGYLCRMDQFCASTERKIQTLLSSAEQQELTPLDLNQVIALLNRQSQYLLHKLEFLDQKAALVQDTPEEHEKLLALRAAVSQQLEEVKKQLQKLQNQEQICWLDQSYASLEGKIQTLRSSAAQQELGSSDLNQMALWLGLQSQNLQNKLSRLHQIAVLVQNIPEEREKILALHAAVSQQLEEVKKRLQDIETQQRKTKNQQFAYQQFYGTVLNQHPCLHEEIDGGIAIREFKSMHADLNAFAENNSRLMPSEKSKLKNIAHKLLEVDLLTGGDRSAIARGEEEKNTQATIYEEVENTSADMARKIHARIASLQEGEYLLLRGHAKGHAFLYEIRKKGGDYCFTIINTGRDEERGLYRNRIDDAKPGRYTYAHKAYQCSLEALSEEFLQSLLPQKATDKEMPVLLQSIDTQLKAKGARDVLGRQHHPQERGNCVFKSVSSWLKGAMIREFGEERGAAIYEEFKAFRTKKMIEQLREMERGMSKQEIAPFYNISVQDNSWKKDLAAARRSRDNAAQQVYRKRQAKTNPMPPRLGDSEYLFNLLKIE